MRYRTRASPLALLACCLVVIWVDTYGISADLKAKLDTLVIDNNICITFANKGYLDFVRNWLSYIRRIGLTNYIVFAYDEETLTALNDLGANVYRDESLTAGLSTDLPAFGSDEFRKIVTKKPSFVLKLLEEGYNVLLSDGDIVFLSDPFKHATGVFVIQSDAHEGHSMGEYPYFANSGFMYIQSNNMTKIFMTDVVHLLYTNPDRMDQDAVNTAMRMWNHKEPLQMSFFQWTAFPNGCVFFMRRVPQRMGVMPVVVHNNWAEGPNKDFIKQYRFREELLWTVDEDTYFGDDTTKYITYEQTSYNNLDLELSALKSALGIAALLHRTLILPRFYSGYTFHDTTADAFLDVKALFGGFSVRESSFLSNPRTPATIRNARIPEIYIWSPVNKEKVPAEGTPEYMNTLLFNPNEPEKGATMEEIIDWVGPLWQMPVLRFRGLAGRFRGFPHNPPMQLNFDHKFREATRFSDYARYGAQNIANQMGKFVCVHMPNYWPDFRDAGKPEGVPEEWSQLGKMLLDKLGGDPYISVYVAMQTDMRAAQFVEHFVNPFHEHFPRVYYINSSLAYPICDLWRLGDHPTIHAMEEEICSKATRFFWTVDENAPKLEVPWFSKRVCQKRAERGMSPCETLLVHTEPPPPPTLTCPVYGDPSERPDMMCDVGHDVQQESPALACECYRHTTEIAPTHGLAHAWLAGCYMGLKQYNKSVEYFEKARTLIPDTRGILVNLGVSYNEIGENQKAIEAYKAAIAKDPTSPEAHFNLGNSYERLGKSDEALQSYLESIRIKPDFAIGYGGVGRAMIERGSGNDAEAYFKAAVHLDPQGGAEFHVELGKLYQNSDMVDKAVQHFERATHIHPGLATAYSNLGVSLMQQYQRQIGFRSLGKVVEDRSYFQRTHNLIDLAVRLDPKCAYCMAQMGDNYKDIHEYDDAIASYTRSLQLDPSNRYVFCVLYYTRYFVCDWSNYDENLAAINEIVQEDLDGKGSGHCVAPLQAMLYKMDAHKQLLINEAYVRRLVARMPSDARNHPAFEHPPPPGAGSPGLRIKWGYVSADFKDHPVAKRMQDVFGFHNRDRVEVYAYSLNVDDGSEWHTKIKNSVDHFVDFSNEGSIVKMAKRIHDDGIQVLINLMGHTRASDLMTGVFALNPAPTSAVHMGFAATMGAKFIGQCVSDAKTSPPDYQEHYTEKLLLMPYSFFPTDYQQTYPKMLDFKVDRSNNPHERPHWGLKDGLFVFCAFNQLTKIDPPMWNTWMRILKRVPNSVLWMLRIHHTYAEKNLMKVAQEQGVPRERFHYTTGFSEEIHLEVKGLADLFLDTQTYSAHSTGADSNWAGVPLLTIAGEKMGNRVAAGMLTAIDLGNTLIARSLEEYEEIAVRLATTRTDVHHKLREHLVENRRAKGKGIFDTKMWVTDYERGLNMNWEVQQATGTQAYHVIVRQRTDI